MPQKQQSSVGRTTAAAQRFLLFCCRSSCSGWRSNGSLRPTTCALRRASTMASLLAVDFEITGKVQKHAKSLGLRGWVANTERGSVVGQLEGPEEPVEAM